MTVMGRLFMLGLVVGVAAAIAVGLPDIKRYLELRAM